MAYEKQLKVMISSTSLDLPDHRKEVLEACQRQGVLAVRMEDLHAHDASADTASLKMVDLSDIYVGVFAHRYGHIPQGKNPGKISITEMEYNRAVERRIPRMIFVMDKKHPVTFEDVEQGEGAQKLAAFLQRVQAGNIVKFFNSPAEVRAELINSLSQYLKERAEEAIKIKSESDLAKLSAAEFHYVSSIPTPPETYVAHTYTLLQTHGLVGRQEQLNQLTDWVAKSNSDIYKANILSIVAIGGMGKSALTWKWFEDISPQEMNPLAGRMWWSFYESDATFENFIIRALAYVSKSPIEAVQKINPLDRETQLLSILDKKPFLIVLDGLERILMAYARTDAAYLSDTDADRITANYVAKTTQDLPAGADESFIGQRRLRKTADPRAGAFLRKLSKARAAKILISTRLYPLDLQRGDALPSPGCFAVFLPGLSNDDALNLWRSFGVSGSHDHLLPIFNSFGNHALLIQALASEIANYRPALRDFEKWREANPRFDPTRSASLHDAMGHVLEYALRGLGNKEQKVLQTIAGFRMPTGYDALSALVTGEGKPCADAPELDAILTELEDRGLVGWDRRANRYDLHPIVRGTVWSGLGDETRQSVYEGLRAHFQAMPMIENYLEVKCLEDLTPAMELYNTLVGMECYDDAEDLFFNRLSKATLYRLSASRQQVEMLEMLFPDGFDKPPRLSSQNAQAFTLVSLAMAYQLSGQPGRAVLLVRHQIMMRSAMEHKDGLSTGLRNISNILRVTGELRESERFARQALALSSERGNRFREAVSLYWLGLTLAARGEMDESKSALRRALRIRKNQGHWQGGVLVNVFLAQRSIWSGEYSEAFVFAGRGWKFAHVNQLETDFIRAARVVGEAALGLGDLKTADEGLHYALTRARAVNMVEEELPALIALAELRRREGNENAARELLDDVWEYAERGPYRLLEADALNVLAQIERDAGNDEKTIEAATKAYQLAWCDGPPYSYHWGLIKAGKHLEELGISPSRMPAFDESKFEPMPEVEINSRIVPSPFY